MNNLDNIKAAHSKYIEWWTPIDLDCDSCLSPMCCHIFCESLLTYDDNWWDRWLNNIIPKDKKQSFKSYILKLIVNHYTGIINLNENE
jgi:hypothetical protein